MEVVRWMKKALAGLQRRLSGRQVGGLPAAPPVAAVVGVSSRLPRVLVVDDNRINRLVTAEMLSMWGITPMQAADGAEAVALACSHEFDLILMDLQMPVLDGLAATAQIRRFEIEQSIRRAPVVAYTTSPVNGSEPVLRACGMDAVLDKPCSAETLHACLCRWFPPMAGVDRLPARARGLASAASR